ncbi:MAG: PAS domain S-box protein [Verrucomicrobia bacterium]|nr:PAS domain S-box protein [Verrucomicrobiota bacterium]MBT7066802.1 PAS domain S-box protein [Verrucomicrobiota bacterium]
MAVLLLCAAVAAAAPQRLRVAVFDAYPLCRIPTADVPESGLFLNLLEIMAAEEEWVLEYVLATPDGCVAMVEKGEVDLAVAVAYTRAREARVTFSQVPVISTWAQVYVPHRSDIQSLLDLEGHSLGMVEGDIYAQDVRRLVQQLDLSCQFVEFERYDEILEALERGWVEAGVVDRLYGLVNAENFDIRSTAIMVAPVELRFAATRKLGPPLISLLDYHLSRLKNDPRSEYHQFMERTLGVGESTVNYRSIAWVVIGAAAAVFFLLAISFLLRRDVQKKTRELSRNNEALEAEIARRKGIADDLSRSEARYRGFFNQSPIGIGLFDASARLIESNQAYLDIFGADSGGRLEGLHLSTMLSPPGWSDTTLGRGETVRYRADCNFDHVAAINLYITHRTGTSHLDVVIVPLRREGHEVVSYLAQVQDITPHIEAESEHSRLVAAVEQSAEAIVITDAQGLIEYINPQFEKTTGYSLDEVRGRNPSLLKSGKQDDAFYEALWATIVRGEIWRGHFVNRKKNGQLFEEEATISPVKNESGEIINYVAVKRDVTHENEMEERLQQAQKMEAIGTLAGGIAHDFNNILTSIIGYTQLAESETEDNPDAQNYLEQVRKASRRAAELIKQILSFSRSSMRERSLLNVGSLVQEALKLLRSTIPTTIEIKQQVDLGCGPILADATQMHQVVMNLCTNAYQAIEEHGSITVTLKEVTMDEVAPGMRPDTRAPHYAQLVIGDTGCGMDTDTEQRIFEPYFTTKSGGEGTGLGLSMVHSIVYAHDGFISVASDCGEGTTFTLMFPIVRSGAEAADDEAAIELLPRGCERILFVDDEEMIVFLGRTLLEGLGYKVVACTDSQNALAAFLKAPDSFDLVLTDQTMPGLTGSDLALEVRKHRADIPIVLCSGYSPDMTMTKMRKIGIAEYIMKPVDRSILAQAVRRALDGGVVAGRAPSATAE